MHHPIARRSTTAGVAIASIVFAALGVSGCGGDETPDEAKDFCSALKTIEELDLEAAGVDAFTEALGRVDDAAPEAVAEDTAVMRQFVDRSAEISALPAQDQAAAIEDFGLLPSQFDAAVVAVEDYARINCPDLEESFFES